MREATEARLPALLTGEKSKCRWCWVSPCRHCAASLEPAPPGCPRSVSTVAGDSAGQNRSTAPLDWKKWQYWRKWPRGSTEKREDSLLSSSKGLCQRLCLALGIVKRFFKKRHGPCPQCAPYSLGMGIGNTQQQIGSFWNKEKTVKKKKSYN